MSKEQIAAVTAALIDHPWPVGSRIRFKAGRVLVQELVGQTGIIDKIVKVGVGYAYEIMVDNPKLSPHGLRIGSAAVWRCHQEHFEYLLLVDINPLDPAPEVVAKETHQAKPHPDA